MRVNNLPLAYYKRGMPNICQVNPRSSILEEKGGSFCGPTSVSNALIWLSKYHFRSIVPPLGNQSELTFKLRLVEELAELMETNSYGTSVNQLISGLRKYIRDRGYRVETEWKGVEHNEEYHCGILTGPEWLMENMLESSNAILDLEFRKNSPYRTDGHFVTGAGFNRTYNNFYVHDPSPLTRITPTFIEIEYVDDRYQLSGLTRRYGQPNNFFKINEFDSAKFKWNDNVATLTGAIAFTVYRK